MHDIIKSRLSYAVVITFLIGLVLFVYVYIKDRKKTDYSDRPNEDNIWIIVFLVILVIGLLVSLFTVYRNHAQPPIRHNYTKPKSLIIPYERFGNRGYKYTNNFVGIPRFGR